MAWRSPQPEPPLASVVIHPAYGWHCPDCQSANFAFLAVNTVPIPQQPYPAGTTYYAGPDFVACGTCKHEFAVPPTSTPAIDPGIVPVPPPIITEAPVPKTLGDLAKAVALDRATLEQDDREMVALVAKRAADDATLKADSDTLNRAVAVVEFRTDNPDGTASAYLSDGKGGVDIRTLQPDSTPIPDSPVPDVPPPPPNS
jgi:hypothetical protein